MDKSTQLSRAAERRQEGLKYPPRFEAELASLAAESDLALLVVEGHQPPQLLTSNNNSICHAFQSSTAHAHLCDPYCGEAHSRARESEDACRYLCHAGLRCCVVPLEFGKGERLAVITGRAFVSTKDYSALVERFRAGDLRDLLGPDLLSNVLFASEPEIESLARRVRDCADEIAARRTGERKAAEVFQPALIDDGESADLDAAGDADIFPPGIGLEEACQRALDAVADRHGLHALSLYLRRDDVLTPVCATGRFKVAAPH
ncbi:MAG: PocR ligand-binding domain-containing protein, partial [Acidobacteriota bacterium]|nr:PocR ligand-binding domain-containing protein [Acidobacteriota bacterium]